MKKFEVHIIKTLTIVLESENKEELCEAICNPKNGVSGWASDEINVFVKETEQEPINGGVILGKIYERDEYIKETMSHKILN